MIPNLIESNIKSKVNTYLVFEPKSFFLSWFSHGYKLIFGLFQHYEGLKSTNKSKKRFEKPCYVYVKKRFQISKKIKIMINFHLNQNSFMKSHWWLALSFTLVKFCSQAYSHEINCYFRPKVHTHGLSLAVLSLI